MFGLMVIEGYTSHLQCEDRGSLPRRSTKQLCRKYNGVRFFTLTIRVGSLALVRIQHDTPIFGDRNLSLVQPLWIRRSMFSDKRITWTVYGSWLYIGGLQLLYCVRLSVRTSGFQPEKTSSTLVRSTNMSMQVC